MDLLWRLRDACCCLEWKEWCYGNDVKAPVPSPLLLFLLSPFCHSFVSSQPLSVSSTSSAPSIPWYQLQLLCALLLLVCLTLRGRVLRKWCQRWSSFSVFPCLRVWLTILIYCCLIFAFQWISKPSFFIITFAVVSVLSLLLLVYLNALSIFLFLFFEWK